ncbi:cytochrome P450 [Amylocarpus encephaloides]|uniref:Cytochrome P450 n=1 Tax=Amylocarpus encephaloides TaxID=45428 RepID=A0A9P7YDU8_9HELO|nr:cytochrome P450 [Amylocarpus encephaloides]
MHSTALLLVAVVVLIVVLYISRSPTLRKHGVALKRPPNTLFLVGNGLLFLQTRHRLFSWFVKCERLFGLETFQISVPSLPAGVVINDPKNLEYVFKNEGIFAKGDFFKRRSWDLFGNGIINADGDLWRVQRKAGLNFLNNANLKILTEVALPQYLKESIKPLREVQTSSLVDLQAIFHELTTQLMGRMAYGTEMHHSDPFSEAFDFASGATGERFQNPLWKLTEIFFGHRFRESVQEVKSFGSEIVRTAVANNETKTDHGFASDTSDTLQSVSGSLINSLLESIGDHQMVADAALNYLTAGRDTTAQALTWAFYLMMRHPHVIDTLRTEVEKLAASCLKESTSPSLHGASSIDTSIFRPASLPYVMAVFYETLRLFPPVPFEIKQCEQATTLPDGTFLPQGSIVFWSIWAMNRSRITWGEGADDFDPDRWLENGNLVSKTAFEFPVFNGGPRTCLGKKMAEIVAVQTIATMVLDFDFEPIDDEEREVLNSLTLPMEDGLPCLVKSRT